MYVTLLAQGPSVLVHSSLLKLTVGSGTGNICLQSIAGCVQSDWTGTRRTNSFMGRKYVFFLPSFITSTWAFLTSPSSLFMASEIHPKGQSLRWTSSSFTRTTSPALRFRLGRVHLLLFCSVCTYSRFHLTQNWSGEVLNAPPTTA